MNGRQEERNGSRAKMGLAYCTGQRASGKQVSKEELKYIEPSRCMYLSFLLLIRSTFLLLSGTIHTPEPSLLLNCSTPHLVLHSLPSTCVHSVDSLAEGLSVLLRVSMRQSVYIDYTHTEAHGEVDPKAIGSPR